MDKVNAPNRKTGRMVVKNLIILLVLAVVAALAIWAWFTSQQTATADGISVKTKASGVQVSWSGADGTYYDDLTALTTAEVVESQKGLAKTLTAAESKLKLITGNGTSFFLPALNRRTGNVITNADNSWKGSDIATSEGRYVDMDLYFRSDMAKNVYLAGDSKVYPKSTTERISDYGDFSSDYISSAARVAFLNAAKTSTSFIWAPNNDYELKESANGYTKYTTTDTETVVTTVPSALDGGAVENGNTYYFWTLKDGTYASPPTSTDALQAYQMTYNSTTRYYETTFTLTVPQYTANTPSIPFDINTSGTTMQNSDRNNYFDASTSYANNLNGQGINISEGEWNVGSITMNQFFVETNIVPINTVLTYKIGYNPQTKVITMLNYSDGSSGSYDWDRGGSQTSTQVSTTTYYPLADNTNLVLANADSAAAVSSANTDCKNTITFKTSDKLNITSSSITTYEQFTAIKTGSGSQATYVFKNKKMPSKYLSVSGTTVLLSATQTAFRLAYISGYGCPVLKNGDNYLVYSGGLFKMAAFSSLSVGNAVTIYTGSSYEVLTNSTALQNYEYYSNTDKTVHTLNGTSTPPLFDTEASGSSDTRIGNTPVATLSKQNETDQYYTAHIVIRVWAEGTDRDALVPLAGGMFDTSLHFVSEKEG